MLRGANRIRPGTHERGSALLELALVMPVALAMIGAIVDGAWALHQAALVTAAAEAAQRTVAIEDTGGGRCAGVPPASYGDVSRAAAAAAAPTLDPSSTSVAVRYLEPACTGRMRTLIVDVTYTLHALTPWFARLLNGRRLTAEAGSAVEEVPPSWWGSAAQVQSDQAQIGAELSQISSLQSQLAADQSAMSSQQSAIAGQQDQLSARQSQITALQSQLAADQSAMSSQQSAIAGQQDQLSARQSQITALTSAYQAVLSAYQTASSAYQAASSAYDAEVSLASALSQTAAYYYAQWQQLLTRGTLDGTREQ